MLSCELKCDAAMVPLRHVAAVVCVRYATVVVVVLVMMKEIQESSKPQLLGACLIIC